jgi:hypothetical protein
VVAGACDPSSWPVRGESVERISAYRFFDEEVVGFQVG